MAGQVRIVVDGMTASGKSTMVSLLAGELGLKIMPEVFNDPFELLPRYAYDAKWCLPMQLNFLTTRHAQYLVAAEAQDYILDRSIFSDKVYADLYYRMGHLDEHQYATYVNLHDNLMHGIPKPECMLFLTCPFDKIMYRIIDRGREFEIHQGEAYWRGLYEAYDRHIERMIKAAPFQQYLLINTGDLNYRDNPEDKAKLVNKINSALAANQIGIA